MMLRKSYSDLVMRVGFKKKAWCKFQAPSIGSCSSRRGNKGVIYLAHLQLRTVHPSLVSCDQRQGLFLYLVFLSVLPISVFPHLSFPPHSFPLHPGGQLLRCHSSCSFSRIEEFTSQGIILLHSPQKQLDSGGCTGCSSRGLRQPGKCAEEVKGSLGKKG